MITKLYNALNSAIKRGFNALFFSCRDMTRAESSQADLTGRIGWRLRKLLHLCLCRFCRGYHRQVKLINKQSQAFAEDYPKDESVKLEASARERIRNRLRRPLDDGK